MDILDRIHKALQAKQVELAKEALKSPSGRDSFAYGRVCGVYAGLQEALEVIESTIQDQDQKESEL